MKKTSLLSVIVILTLTVSADAQFHHRSVFHRHGVQQVVPQSFSLAGLSLGSGNLSLPQLVGPPSEAKIQVSADVRDSISRTSNNLQDARTDLSDLMKKYKLDSTSTTSGTSTGVDHNLPPRVRGLTVQQFLDAFR